MSALNNVIELIRKNGNEAITITWEQFYRLVNRERLYDSFLNKLKENLKKKDVHIIYGNNVVIIARDFCWRSVEF